MRQQWDITPEDLDKFLTWLDPDREQAERKYEVIRQKLERFFLYPPRACGPDAAQLADETINRVIRKMRTLADSYVGERLPFFIGVARKVHQEYLEEQRRKQNVDPLPPPDSHEKKEMLDRCLQRCMKKLPEKERDLIIRYYTGDKGEKIVQRKKLAEELEIAPNALTIRAHRIRTKLRHCLEECVEEEGNDETNSRNHH